MDKKKVLVKVHPEGKFVVDVDKNIDINDITPNCRVALRNDSYTLHKILPNKVDPLVNAIKIRPTLHKSYYSNSFYFGKSQLSGSQIFFFIRVALLFPEKY